MTVKKISVGQIYWPWASHCGQCKRRIEVSGYFHVGLMSEIDLLLVRLVFFTSVQEILKSIWTNRYTKYWIVKFFLLIHLILNTYIYPYILLNNIQYYPFNIIYCRTSKTKWHLQVFVDFNKIFKRPQLCPEVQIMKIYFTMLFIHQKILHCQASSMYVWFQKNVKRYSCWLFVQILLSHSDCCQQSSFFSIFFLWYTKLLILYWNLRHNFHKSWLNSLF